MFVLLETFLIKMKHSHHSHSYETLIQRHCISPTKCLSTVSICQSLAEVTKVTSHELEHNGRLWAYIKRVPTSIPMTVLQRAAIPLCHTHGLMFKNGIGSPLRKPELLLTPKTHTELRMKFCDVSSCISSKFLAMTGTPMGERAT